MKKLIVAAAALFAITASAHAETYNVEGVTIHVGNGCRSSSCVSVYAPGYGYYHGERSSARVHKAHKDAARVAAMAKKDDAATPAAAAPAVEAAPAAETAPVKTPDATPQADPQAAPSDATPAK
jgi:hypothetical protein